MEARQINSLTPKPQNNQNGAIMLNIDCCLNSKYRQTSFVIAELRRPEGPPSAAPYSYRKKRETHELIFSWLSWLAVLLAGVCARRRPRRSCLRWRPYPNNRLTKTYSHGLQCTSLIFGMDVMTN